ncbi:FAD-dependent oxidoreductase [Robbsia sp. KACC 23696]|uniref:NAD(P)/FAD-dependent oxidoreductase n=1 Tax=Robbsia sp. KACC 23696 TaxID=3149231 RepID=UPI00325B95BC
MPQRDQSIAVVGAGIVGVCAAYHLQQAGYRVTLIDRDGVAAGASHGNAGCINPSSIIPVAMPGVLKKMPGWLMDPDGPLVLRPRYLPTMLPWLMRFLAASDATRVAAQVKTLRTLAGSALRESTALADAVGAGHLLRSVGHLTAYSTQAAYDGDSGSMQRRAAEGIVVEDVDRDALRAREPHLADTFLRARYIGETGHVIDPAAYAKHIADHVRAHGGTILRANVTGIATRDGRAIGVQTDTGLIATDADAIVVAAGAWSGALARGVGDKVLLDTERGYHIEIPHTLALPDSLAAVGPRIPTLWAEAKIFATPMAGRVRAAGTVELAGMSAPANWRRTDLLARQLARMYPALAPAIATIDTWQDSHRDGAPPGTASVGMASGHADARAAASTSAANAVASETPRRWLGFRPSTPDSLPVIDRSPRVSNLIYAFGHGHIGLTCAPATGRLVAALITGETPTIDLRPFAITRFQ